MTQAIIFDCFGVLARSGTWEHFTNTLPPDVDMDAVHALNHRYDAGHLTKEDFLYQIHDITGHEPEMLEEIVDIEGLKNKALLRYIEQDLKPRFKIGLLSNIATNWVRESFLTSEEQALFDEMVFSFEVGITKPNPEIFQIICSRLQVEPTDSVFIDDIDSNVVGAKQAGLIGLQYHNLAKLKQDLAELIN